MLQLGEMTIPLPHRMLLSRVRRPRLNDRSSKSTIMAVIRLLPEPALLRLAVELMLRLGMIPNLLPLQIPTAQTLPLQLRGRLSKNIITAAMLLSPELARVSRAVGHTKHSDTTISHLPLPISLIGPQRLVLRGQLKNSTITAEMQRLLEQVQV